MLYHCKDPERPRVLLLRPTGISAVNKGGADIYSGLEIKPGSYLLGLNDKSKAALRNKISDVKFLAVDGFTIRADIGSWLGEVFKMLPKMLPKCFVADPLRKLIFSQFSVKYSMKPLLGLQLRHLYKYAEFTEVVRQNDTLIIDLLNKVRVGNINDDAEKVLKARLIHESDENYSKDAMHMYAENEHVMKRNQAVLNDLPGDLQTIKANDCMFLSCHVRISE